MRYLDSFALALLLVSLFSSVPVAAVLTALVFLVVRFAMHFGIPALKKPARLP